MSSLEVEIHKKYLDAKSEARKIKDKGERKLVIAKLKEQYKMDKPVEIYGEYFGSHKAIPEHIKMMALVAHGDGISIYSGRSFNRRKELLVTAPWSSILDFSFKEDTRTETSGRVTATRAVALGIFSLAAKKKTVESTLKLASTLKTKTGDIVIEYTSHIDNTNTSTGSIMKSSDDALVRANSKFRASVANHTGKLEASEPKEIII